MSTQEGLKTVSLQPSKSIMEHLLSFSPIAEDFVGACTCKYIESTIPEAFTRFALSVDRGFVWQTGGFRNGPFVVRHRQTVGVGGLGIKSLAGDLVVGVHGFGGISV